MSQVLILCILAHTGPVRNPLGTEVSDTIIPLMQIKLLIVDDAPFIREVMGRAFSKTEVEVVGFAVDGEDAIARAREFKPDVILMDIVMPKKSGLEATVEILKLYPQTRIIACTTVDQNTMVLRALDAGCCGFVTKPFTTQDLIKAVTTAAQNKAKEAGV